MSQAPDPLEAELSALRPHEVSPELRRRIARRLADVPPARVRGLRWLALAGGLAAAGLVVVLLWRAGGPRVEPKPTIVRTPPAPPLEVEDVGPMLLAYQRALARSPEDLDALLNQHAIGDPEPNPALVRLRACTRSEAELHALLGEN
jgi:hypothetical protein